MPTDDPIILNPPKPPPKSPNGPTDPTDPPKDTNPPLDP